MADGYTPFYRPVEKRDEMIKKATYEELREGLMWSINARAAAEDEYHVFATALGEMLAEQQEGQG